MTAIVQRVGNADIVEVESEVPDLASAVQQLQTAVAGMSPDDVSFEFYTEKRRRSRADASAVPRVSPRHLKADDDIW
jgi:hypothetical protein